MIESPRLLAAPDLERYVIGCLLVDPTVHIAIAPLLRSDDFYMQRWRLVYDAITTLSDQGAPVDFVTVADELEKQGHLTEIGGAAALTSALTDTPTVMHVDEYAKRIANWARLRRTIAILSDAVKAAYNADEDDLTAALSEVGTLIDRTLDQSARGARSLSDELAAATAEIERRAELGLAPGLMTGMADIDKITRGLQPGELVYVAGRPGMGKTSLMLVLADAFAKADASPALYSLEMTNEQIVHRLIAAYSHIDVGRLRSGTIQDSQWPAYTDAIGKIHTLDLDLFDLPAIPVEQIGADARALAHKGCKVLIVDYLQLMAARPRESLYEATTRNSQALKNLARTLGMVLIVGSQLSRAVEQRSDKRPVLSDLRESGAIEQDADQVWFLYRDDYYNPQTQTPNVAEVHVAKNRNGPTGTAFLYFAKERAWFYPLAKVGL